MGALGRGRYLSVFGFLLGMGVITTMPSPIMLALGRDTASTLLRLSTRWPGAS